MARMKWRASRIAVADALVVGVVAIWIADPDAASVVLLLLAFAGVAAGIWAAAGKLGRHIAGKD